MLTRAERITAALTIAFVLSLALVSRSDDPFVWLAWGVTVVVAAGAALISFNR